LFWIERAKETIYEADIYRSISTKKVLQLSKMMYKSILLLSAATVVHGIVPEDAWSVSVTSVDACIEYLCLRDETCTLKSYLSAGYAVETVSTYAELLENPRLGEQEKVVIVDDATGLYVVDGCSLSSCSALIHYDCVYTPPITAQCPNGSDMYIRVVGSSSAFAWAMRVDHVIHVTADSATGTYNDFGTNLQGSNKPTGWIHLAQARQDGYICAGKKCDYPLNAQATGQCIAAGCEFLGIAEGEGSPVSTPPLAPTALAPSTSPGALAPTALAPSTSPGASCAYNNRPAVVRMMYYTALVGSCMYVLAY
jgi:hypothetical protein